MSLEKEGDYGVNFSRINTILMDENSKLTYEKARTWIELVWEDFEATYAKAGYEYKGKEVTEKVVRQWITTYGSKST